MKALEKSAYREYDVSQAFNEIIISQMDSYNGRKKQQLKSFLEDLQRGGMIEEFIYHSDCKAFYIKHLDDLEDYLGVSISNRYESPHYTFMCWLCFEEYCFE